MSPMPTRPDDRGGPRMPAALPAALPMPSLLDTMKTKQGFDDVMDGGRRRMIFHTDVGHRLTFEDVSGKMMHSAWELVAPARADFGDMQLKQPDTVRIESGDGTGPAPKGVAALNFTDPKQRAALKGISDRGERTAGFHGAAFGAIAKGAEMANRWHNQYVIDKALEKAGGEIVRRLRAEKSFLCGALLEVSFTERAPKDVQVTVAGTARLLGYAMTAYRDRNAKTQYWKAEGTVTRLVWAERC